jgi:flagellin
MSLRINNNISALNGHRNMVKNDAAVSKSLERLSSGMRINRAADDAAGLIISEQMRAQLTGLQQALANSEQAVTLVQTAEGALDEVSNLLNKARSLAIHAANEGLNDQNALAADQTELDNVIDSVNRIAANTQFGTKKLLDGSLGSGTSNNPGISSVKLGGDYTAKLAAGTAVKGYHTLQITTVATQSSIDLTMAGSSDVWSGGSLAAASGADVAQKAFTLSINGAKVAITSGTTKSQFIQQINAVGATVGFTAFNTGAEAASGLGNITLKMGAYGSLATFDIQFVGGATGASTVGTANSAVGINAAATLFVYSGNSGPGGAASSGATQQITFTSSGNGLRLVSAGGSSIVLAAPLGISSGSGGNSGFYFGAIDGTTGGATFQIGANVNQTATVELGGVTASQIGSGGSGTYANLSQLRGSALISGQAQEALKVIDKAIDDVTTTRGNLGAFQSATLETTLNSLRVTEENLTTAESTIRDVDFAEESARFTKNNILVQSSTAMLAQANQLPQNVLKLLQ